MNSQEKATEFLALLKLKEEMDQKLKEVNKTINGRSAELYEMMEEENVDSVEIDGIKFQPKIEQDFGLKEELKGQKWDDIGVWFAWLKAQGEDGLIKKKETVPANTRKKFLKEWVAENRPLPEFVDEKFINTIKYNKSAIRRMINGEA